MNSLRAERAKRALQRAGYWLVSLTWGGLMTWTGAFIALVMLLSRHAPQKLGPNVYFEVGLGWGGMEYGAFFFVSKDAGEETRLHEAGHGIQNLVLGPLMPFLVCIPSALRYWMRRCKTLAGKRVFSGAVCLLLAFLGAAGMIAAALLGLSGGVWALFGVGLFLVLYAAALCVWMQAFEIPKYRYGAYVSYDGIWFEASATRLGEQYYG
ncbi:MAG TPA: hypothetical protein H9797_04715 [Candidatus Gallimonas gallistercoris]|uniref:Uncharacterized protein n=1 Tax=Candidatus Gallimonas gallistercoris TaxID=2838602 RepID=A0A9D2H348_9FIRM|nr:hypothetical protein [Candidatus Gallimonas gallistercoris]